MRHKLWQFFFGEESLVRQSYAWFFLSLGLCAVLFLPYIILIKITFVLSCLAITVSAQTFISSARGNRRLVKVLEHIEDLVEEMHKLRKDVNKITPDDQE